MGAFVRTLGLPGLDDAASLNCQPACTLASLLNTPAAEEKSAARDACHACMHLDQYGEALELLREMQR